MLCVGWCPNWPLSCLIRLPILDWTWSNDFFPTFCGYWAFISLVRIFWLLNYCLTCWVRVVPDVCRARGGECWITTPGPPNAGLILGPTWFWFWPDHICWWPGDGSRLAWLNGCPLEFCLCLLALCFACLSLLMTASFLMSTMGALSSVTIDSLCSY